MESTSKQHFLLADRRSGRDEENNTAEDEDARLEQQWTTVATIPLHCAYVTRYERATDKLRYLQLYRL